MHAETIPTMHGDTWADGSNLAERRQTHNSSNMNNEPDEVRFQQVQRSGYDEFDNIGNDFNTEEVKYAESQYLDDTQNYHQSNSRPEDFEQDKYADYQLDSSHSGNILQSDALDSGPGVDNLQFRSQAAYFQHDNTTHNIHSSPIIGRADNLSEFHKQGYLGSSEYDKSAGVLSHMNEYHASGQENYPVNQFQYTEPLRKEDNVVNQATNIMSPSNSNQSAAVSLLQPFIIPSTNFNYLPSELDMGLNQPPGDYNLNVSAAHVVPKSPGLGNPDKGRGHAMAIFAFGGKLITCFPSRLKFGNNAENGHFTESKLPGRVALRNISTVRASSKVYVNSELAAPIYTPKHTVSKKTLLDTIAVLEKLPECDSDRLVLCEYLKALVTNGPKNGATILQTFLETLGPFEGHKYDDRQGEIKICLLAGAKQKACDVAMKSGMWVHALILAGQISRSLYTQVVKHFTDSKTDLKVAGHEMSLALRVIYNVFGGAGINSCNAMLI